MAPGDSAKGDVMKLSQVETAARRRQQVLDFLHANPGAKMGAIGACLFGETESRSRHHNSVMTMIQWNEVRFEGSPRSRRYWALVTTTRPAIEVQQARETDIRRKNGERLTEASKHVTNSSLGIYVHTPGKNKHGTPGEGGQGALRRTVYINCHQSY